MLSNAESAASRRSSSVSNKFLDCVRREIRRVVQDDTDFLAELGLECVQQPDRRVAVEVLFAGQKERFAAVADRTE